MLTDLVVRPPLPFVSYAFSRRRLFLNLSLFATWLIDVLRLLCIDTRHADPIFTDNSDWRRYAVLAVIARGS
jgi:hypothetical protein